MSKCIKCGRELTSAEIPEFYNGMCEKCCKELNCAEYPFKQGINDYQNQIDQLKQQLDEKDTRIAELEDKDWYEACIKQLEEQNNRLIDTLKEKDKEIELLKHLGNHEITVEMFKENTKLIIEKRQFAISELEKVKKLTENLLEKFCNSWEYNQKYMRGHRHIEYYDLIQGIDNQIKELKGEKDAEG